MIRVCEYQSDYRQQVIDLITHIQQNEFGIAITAEDQPDLANITDFYQVNSGNFWVARDNECTVGTISLLDIGDQQLALRKMFVQDDYRGMEKRVAALLLTEALHWAKSRSIKQVFLGTTSKFKAAHRFYEKNGFLEITKSQLPKSFPVMAVDTRFYCYSF